MPLKNTLSDLVEETRGRSSVKEVGVASLTQAPQPGDRRIVIDVRETSERSVGHVPGSIHIPRGVIERDIEKEAFAHGVREEDLHRPILLYCGGGSRSLLAGAQLERMGFTDVASLAGGFKAYREAGLPVEHGPGRQGPPPPAEGQVRAER